MLRRWLALATCLLPALANASDASTSALPVLAALTLITLLLSTSFQLWQHPDILQSDYRKSVFLLLSGSVLAAVAWSSLGPESATLSVCGYALILSVTQAVISHWIRLAEFEKVQDLMLREVAQKTASLEEKNQELKSAQRALRIANLELKALSCTDGLTDTYNRLYFDRQFLTEWQRARREQDPVSLILVDIDHFKELNDQHGHLAGDNALKFVTKLLKKGFQRGNDIACRYGGEEFVILLPNTLPANALTQAEKVRKSIESQPFLHEGSSLNITASFGVGGLVPQPEHDPLDLLNATDQALYYVKRNGRNGCHLATRYDGVTRSSNRENRNQSSKAR
ncbi:GGDEF domain-containing protein [Pseudomaricurvus sp.]|uniref:GGDEF domain-containing protein n=1 Tax=Pseudomaricurvus sp. TaxID=2004510 RepID=UPI003F6BE845